nr:hypothetical protein [uncultured Neisseria sp.]
MNTINPKLQRMIDEFASAYLSHIGNPAVLKHNLEAAIKDSPELTLKLNRAAEQGYIQKFGILDTKENPNAAAGYVSGEGNTPPTMLIRPEILVEKEDKISLMFQLAHETQHSFYHHEQGGLQTEQQVRRGIAQLAASTLSVKDYTPPLRRQLDSDRNDEALAMLAGWNAVASHVRQNNPKAGFSEISKAMGEQEGYAAYFGKPARDEKSVIPDKNLEFNPDMSLSLNSDKNREVLAQSYFDRNPQIDYRNNNARIYIGFIVQQHYSHDASSKLVVGMKELGLKEQIIESGKGLDLGRYNHAPYYEPSDLKKPLYFDEIGTRTKQNVRQMHISEDAQSSRVAALIAKYQAATAALDAGDSSAAKSIMGENPVIQKIMERFDAELERRQSLREFENSRYTLENMPERARDLHAQITDKLTAYVKENNLPYTKEGLQNSITALTAEAFDQKMTQVDHIGIHNDKLAVHQDGRFIHDFAEVDAFQSRLTPERDSFQNIVQAEQKHEQEAQQRETERQMEQSRGMGMSR